MGDPPSERPKSAIGQRIPSPKNGPEAFEMDVLLNFFLGQGAFLVTGLFDYSCKTNSPTDRSEMSFLVFGDDAMELLRWDRAAEEPALGAYGSG